MNWECFGSLRDLGGIESMKFKDWTDDELEQLAETIAVCYSESMGPDTEIDSELLDEMETRGLDEPWWAEVRRKGEE